MVLSTTPDSAGGRSRPDAAPAGFRVALAPADPTTIGPVLEVVIAGLVTGWAIAIPIGAVGALLVALTARTSMRTGSPRPWAWHGRRRVRRRGRRRRGGDRQRGSSRTPAGCAPRLPSCSSASPPSPSGWVAAAAGAAPLHPRRPRPPPWQAFAAFLALTAVNPTTVVYFAAVVIGNPDLADGWAEGVVFVTAAFVASASWQLALAGLGSVLGRSVTSRRGRVVTAWVSGAGDRRARGRDAARGLITVPGPRHRFRTLRGLLSATRDDRCANDSRSRHGFHGQGQGSGRGPQGELASTEVRDSEQAYRDLGMLAYLTTTGGRSTRPTASG